MIKKEDSGDYESEEFDDPFAIKKEVKEEVVIKEEVKVKGESSKRRIRKPARFAD